MSDKPFKIKYPYQAPEGYFDRFPSKLEKWRHKTKQERNQKKKNVFWIVGLAASFLILVLTAVLSIDYLKRYIENTDKTLVLSNNKITQKDVSKEILITEDDIPLEEVLINMSEQELTQWKEVYLIDMFYQTPL